MIRIQVVAALLVTAMAAPAPAQVRVRDHRKLKPAPKISVSSFSPHSGAVGATVTIRGNGFTPDTKVFFGGYDVRPTQVTPKAISITVPRRYRDGSIVLRHPGVARDIRVGTFTVDAAAQMHGFAPTSGVAGTRVAIRGIGFRQGDTVTLAGQPVRVLRVSPKRITIAIPANATSGRLAVARPGGAQASSGGTFTVVQPAPTISRVHPPGGAAGTEIRITGANFTPSDTVRYGRLQARIIRRGPNYIDVHIPPRARKNRHVWVSGPSGEARSPSLFSLEQPPIVQRLRPLYGTVGQRVEIYGTNFRPGDRVSINGLQMRILQLRRQQISVVIPHGAHTGTLEIERGAVRASSPQVFDVVYAPTISSFTPTGGEIGTRVTITGTSLTPDVEVYYGTQRLRGIRRTGTTSVRVKIPRNASDQIFTVRTRGGEATAGQAFRVYWWPKVADVNPRAAFVGSRVTVVGAHLDYIDEIRLGRTPLRILSTGPAGKTMVVEITQGAGTRDHRKAGRGRRGRRGSGGARISYTAFGREYKTNLRIGIHERPTLTNFSPKTGAPGDDILVNGTHFTVSTVVYFGNTPMQVVSRNLPTQLIARVPAEARGADHIWVEQIDARVRSQRPLVVVAAPTLARFAPRKGKPGTEVTIQGLDFGPNVEVLLGGTPCQIIARRGNDLSVQVPAGLTGGKHYFELRENQLSSRARKPFKVIPVAYLASFEPTEGPPGTQILIHGRDLNRRTRAFFGDLELQVTKVERRGTRMWVALPPDITGSAPLSVDEDGIRSYSTKRFRVLQPPPPPPPPSRGGVKVRDHRKKQPRRHR